MWCVRNVGMAECCVPFLDHCDLDLFKLFKSGAYLILFEFGIPNLTCTCIFGRRRVAYHPWVTLTLTSDLVSKIGI